ncbi:MAG: hypothetical protein CVU05_12010 [Bacteroidetes bacterium HGW-Bacteroidetes-21]|jgi:hypothetical protein|nr:MAG: hypothetical protein CVU05_12010 [Bacteroidetes bacterium HGW-Bacteroidetes-21]
MLDKEKYLLPAGQFDYAKLLTEWKWLTGEEVRIIALTKCGDVLLRDIDNNLVFLDTGYAYLTNISDDYHDFLDKNLSMETLEQILQNEIIDHLEDCGLKLNSDEVYSFKVLPVLGGEYDENNMFPMNIYEHFNETGKAQFKIKDIPLEQEIESEED